MTDAHGRMRSLWIAVEPAVGWTLVGLAGSLDSSTVDRLRECLDGLLSAGHTRIAFDVAALEFCDSAGVRCIAGAWRRAGATGGGLLLVRPSEQVRWMLTATGLAERIRSVEMLPSPWPSPRHAADMPMPE